MILSMTGYGIAEQTTEKLLVKVEIRSLNNRYLDFNLRLPASLRDKENEIRNLISEKLIRGKVDVMVVVQSANGTKPSLNFQLAKKYYTELKSLAKELGAEKKNLFPAILQLPEVLSIEKSESSEEEWTMAKATMETAIGDLVSFRINEGAALEKSFRENVRRVATLLAEIEPFERERVESIRARLVSQIKENFSSEEYDRNRLEQELVFYVERIDFSEEKVRLRSHCDFFLKTLDDKESNGRRLTFISQEMGREINTLGAKANHAEIQRRVVQMKDELEKIKEQLLNVL